MKFDGAYDRKRYILSRSADALRFVLTVFDRARQGRRTSANAGGFMRSLLCSRFFKVCTYAQGRLSPAEGQAAGPRTIEGADGCFYMYGRCSRERNERTGQGQLSPGWSRGGCGGCVLMWFRARNREEVARLGVCCPPSCKKREYLMTIRHIRAGKKRIFRKYRESFPQLSPLYPQSPIFG